MDETSLSRDRQLLRVNAPVCSSTFACCDVRANLVAETATGRP